MSSPTSSTQTGALLPRRRPLLGSRRPLVLDHERPGVVRPPTSYDRQWKFDYQDGGGDGEAGGRDGA